MHRLIGVALDGHYFIYVRKVEGHWTDPETEPVNQQTVGRFLRLLVSLTSGKALLPDNLVRDFGANTLTAQRIARSLYQALCRILDDQHTDLVDKLFEQWKTFFGQVTGYEEGSHPLRNRPELRAFARGMGVDPRTVDPPRLFFTVHTYFALLIKLIAYYALSRFVSGFGTRFGSLYQLPDDELRDEMWVQIAHLAARDTSRPTAPPGCGSGRPDGKDSLRGNQHSQVPPQTPPPSFFPLQGGRRRDWQMGTG